jgi:DHA1 family multidrug resistance protein B-like MFS transporter
MLAHFNALHRNIKIRLLVNTIRKFSNELTIPFMTIYLAKLYGALLAGSIIFVILLSGAISSLYGGIIADQYARNKILIKCEGMHFISIIMMVFGIMSASIGLLIFGYFFKNIFVTLSTASSEAVIIDASRVEQRGFIYSLQYWTTNISIPIGSMLGAFLFDKYFVIVISFTALISMLVFSAYCLLQEIPLGNLKENKRTEEKRKRYDLGGYRLVLQDKKYMIFILSTLCLYAVEFQFTAYVAVAISTAIHSPASFIFGKISGVELYGSMRAVNTAMIVFLTPAAIYFLSKELARKYIVGLHLLYIIPFSLLTVYVNPYVTLLCVILFTCGEIFVSPLRYTIMAAYIPEKSRGKYLSVFHLGVRGGNIIAALILTGSHFIPAVGVTSLILFLGLVSIVLL